MTFKDYAIVSGAYPTQLSAEVASYIENGWEPHGEPYCANGTHCQAMVKREAAQINVPTPTDGYPMHWPILVNGKSFVPEQELRRLRGRVGLLESKLARRDDEAERLKDEAAGLRLRLRAAGEMWRERVRPWWVETRSAPYEGSVISLIDKALETES